MKVILFMMFFVAPPSDAPPAKKVWALQSTSSLEFDSKPACVNVIQNQIIPSIKTTDTVSVFGWCLPSDQNAAGFDADGAPSFFQWPPPPSPRKGR